MPPIKSRGMVEGYEYGTAGEPINQRQATVGRITPWTDKPTSLLTAESTPYTASEGNPLLFPGAPLQAFAAPRPVLLGPATIMAASCSSIPPSTLVSAAR